MLKRIAQTHRGHREVAERLIPLFLTRVGPRDFREGEGLYAFREGDYSDVIKQAVRAALRQSPWPAPDAVLACGIANMQDEIPFLKQIEQTLANSTDALRPTRMNPLAWNATLACARMGDKQSIERVMATVRSLQDPIPKLHEVGYIRQPEGIAFLQDILFSEEKVLVSPLVEAGSEVRPMEIPYARYAIDVLGLALENFPIAWNALRNYSDADIAKARQWMIENRGKWKIIR